MDHFYITLPSNSSESVYGKQKLCSYKTKPLNLNVDEWEVGLAEVIYPHTWNNVKEGTFSIKKLNDRDELWEWTTVKIPSARYENPEQLVDTLNDAVHEVLGKAQREHIYFMYNSLLRKFVAHVSVNYRVRFPASLAHTLGLGDVETTLKQSTNEIIPGQVDPEADHHTLYSADKTVATYVMDLDRGLHTFFVYCDIVEYQLVGDANVPLLRTVNVLGKSGDVVVNSFDNIHYIGLGRSSFQEIHIHISDDTGERVPFQHGRVIVKLHFRRK